MPTLERFLNSFPTETLLGFEELPYIVSSKDISAIESLMTKGG
jgi:hypothetical protein